MIRALNEWKKSRGAAAKAGGNNPLVPALRSGCSGRSNAKPPSQSSPLSNFLAFTALLALAATFPLNRVWAADTAKPQKDLTLPGEVFEVDGRTAFVILPAAENLHTNRPTPWVWYAPTLSGLPEARERWMFERFLAAGIAVAGVDVGESYGNPQGRAHFNALYRELVERRGFSRKPVLLPRSRGGLMLYNWAAEHPDSVGGIAGIYPVGDLRSWPGLDQACGAMA
ncbi:MAG: hypothetical protein AB9869_22685 [Verrucomicrobiia bacterium]